MSNQYWAKAPPSDIAHEIKAKMDDHHEWLHSSGAADVMQRLYDAYYNFDEGGFGLHLSKDKSNAKLHSNHYKSLLQRLHSMLTNAKLAYQPKAVNSDAKSQIESDFAKGLLEYYEAYKNMGEYTSELAERALVTLEGYIFAPWDQTQGVELTKDEAGRPILAGDQAFYCLSAFDVAKHHRLKNSPWYIVRVPVNKYDLAAQHPEHAEAIVEMSVERDSTGRGRLITPYDNENTDPDGDIVDVLHLFHRKTPALPKGRQTVIAGTIVLQDSALKYKTIPVVRLSCSDLLETTGADSPATSLLSIQEASDKLWGAVTTNNLANAKQNMWSATGEIDIQALSEGMNEVVSPSKPEALQLTQSAPETYKLLDSYQNQLEILSGVNKVSRGNPDSAVDTAAGQALMIAQAIEFVSDPQRQYARACGELGTIVVHNIQVFCDEPRIAYIGGNSRKSYAKEFKNTDLMSIDRVTCDIGNPMMQTISGRYTLASQWAKDGVIKDPAKLVEFLRTGQVDSLTEDQFKDSVLIRNENEEIRRGEGPIVALYDLHPQHILEHKALASDPAFRYDPNLMRVLNDHIQAHLDTQKSMPPDLAAILGIPPLPSQQQPPQAPQPPEQGPPSVQGQALPTLPDEAPPETQQTFDEFSQQFQQPNQDPGVM